MTRESRIENRSWGIEVTRDRAAAGSFANREVVGRGLGPGKWRTERKSLEAAVYLELRKFECSLLELRVRCEAWALYWPEGLLCRVSSAPQERKLAAIWGHPLPSLGDSSVNRDMAVTSRSPAETLSKTEQAAARRRIGRLLADVPVGGDREKIFEQVYVLYADAILVFFMRRGFSPEDSHDLRQETFLNLFRGIDTFRGRSTFDTWLFGIAANVWRNRLRAGSALRRDGQEVPLPSGEGSEAAVSGAARSEQEDRVVSRELGDRLSDALSELPPKMRRCALLRFRQGLKYREIATLTGTSVATAKAQIHQARGRLRERLADVLENVSVG